MSQHDSLRERIEQHKPKNVKSKIDDKQVYQAMDRVKKYLKEKSHHTDDDMVTILFNIKFRRNFIRKKRFPKLL